MNGAARDQEFGGVTLLDLGLGKDAPQVWRAILANVPLPPDGSWMRVLQADERARMQAFQLPQLQRDFAVSRWVLRTLLAPLFGMDRSTVHLGAESGGKPGVIDPVERGEFNLTHSGGELWVAFHRSCRVGIDYEQANCDLEVEEVAAHVLVAEEQVALAAAPEGECAIEFLRYWTAKEAILKATGEGLQRDPREIELRVSAEGIAIECLPGGYANREAWRLHSWCSDEGVAAMAWVELG